VLASRTVASPKPGTDEIKRACEEAWVGTNGYVRADGSQQRRALAFQGHVVTQSGATLAEVFLIDLPDELPERLASTIVGSATQRPSPPAEFRQRRLTFTEQRAHPGVQGPRHWLRSSPDGSQIGCLRKDDAGVVQLWTVSPATGELRQLTRNAQSISSAFTWSPDGRWIAHTLDGSVCVTDARTGQTVRRTRAGADKGELRPEACVFSPDGHKIAFVRRGGPNGAGSNQICVVSWE